MVPLIAVDELPEWVEIAGVPRELTVEETRGLASLGSLVKEPGVLDVRVHLDPSAVAQLVAFHTAQGVKHSHDMGVSAAEQAPRHDFGTETAEPLAIAATQSVDDQGSAVARVESRKDAVPKPHPAELMKSHWNQQHLQHIKNSYAYPSPAQQMPTNNTSTYSASQSQSTTNTSGLSQIPHVPQVPPVPQVPEKASATVSFCRHWCHHGTCKWGNMCRHTHSMPTTLEGMSEVGLKDFPAWWTGVMNLTLSSIGVKTGTNNLGNMASAASGSSSMCDPRQVRPARPSSAKKKKELRDMLANLDATLTMMENMGGFGLLPQQQYHTLQQVLQTQQKQRQRQQQQTNPKMEREHEPTPLDKMCLKTAAGQALAAGAQNKSSSLGIQGQVCRDHTVQTVEEPQGNAAETASRLQSQVQVSARVHMQGQPQSRLEEYHRSIEGMPQTHLHEPPTSVDSTAVPLQMQVKMPLDKLVDI
jgi:hypothetical protein